MIKTRNSEYLSEYWNRIPAFNKHKTIKNSIQPSSIEMKLSDYLYCIYWPLVTHLYDKQPALVCNIRTYLLNLRFNYSHTLTLSKISISTTPISFRYRLHPLKQSIRHLQFIFFLNPPKTLHNLL